jgi:hypothetical protein
MKGIKHTDGSEHAFSCPCASCLKVRKEEELEEEEKAIEELAIKEASVQNNLVETDGIELYDEKFIDQEVTTFKELIKEMSSKKIEEELDTFLENILDKISEVSAEYKTNLFVGAEMENEINYTTQLQIFMDTMKAVTVAAQAEFEDKSEQEEADEAAIKEYNGLSYNKSETTDDEWDYEGSARGGFRYGTYHDNHKKIVGFAAH